MTKRSWLGLITCIVLVIIFTFFLHPIEGDGDFYHHINTGRLILTHFQLPRVDQWTFTEHGNGWVAYSWATGVLFYLTFSAFGVAGISILVALVGIVSLFLAFQLMKSYHLKEKLIYPLLLLLTSLLLVRFPARPEIFTYPFLLCQFL